jgi:hypothetical protein
MLSRSRLWPLSALLLVACGVPPEDALGPDESDQALRGDRPPAYRDVEESFTTDAEQTRWWELKRALRRDFDDICGDTFCEGDFSNLEALSFRCSVSNRTGLIKSCLWLFAGSYETVTASTGNVRPVAKFFHCTATPAVTPAVLMDALMTPGGRGPLWAPLPGSTQSFYDVLGNCL